MSTKLRLSQAHPKLVARPRLIARLEREPGRKLTLFSAPAGFGKTTLLVEWLREGAGGEGSVARLSLDEGDNDPIRFLSYLVTALRRIGEEGFGEGVLSQGVLLVVHPSIALSYVVGYVDVSSRKP